MERSMAMKRRMAMRRKKARIIVRLTVRIMT
jgi:hypothetical protein